MTHEPPPWTPPGARAVVYAWPYTSPRDDGKRWHLYDLWIVDAQAWTGRLDQPAAMARLVAEGYNRNRAASLLRQAREKLGRIIAAGDWRMAIGPYPGVDADGTGRPRG